MEQVTKVRKVHESFDFEQSKLDSVLVELHELGVAEHNGHAIEELNYTDLKQLLAVERATNINVESSENAWF